MFGYMGIFFPSVVGLFILEKILNDYNFKIKDYFYYFIIFSLFSNIICLVITRIFFNISSYIVASLESYPIFFVKYVIVSLLINLILAITFSCVHKYVEISIEVEEKNVN